MSKKVHKINKYYEAICRGWASLIDWSIPDPGYGSKSWNKVTCKNCLKKR